VAAVRAADPGEALVQVAALQEGQPTPATAGVAVPGQTIVGPETVIGDTVIQQTPQPVAQPAPTDATWRMRPRATR
jgi:hypothetical protein